MTKQNYIDHLNNQNADMMELYHFYFNKRGGKSLSFDEFRYSFSLWLQIRVGFNVLPALQYYVIKELNDYFYV